MMSKPGETTPKRSSRDRKPDHEAREDDRIAGIGGGIAGPAEAGAAGTAGGGTAVGGETSAISKPSAEEQTSLSDVVADALHSAAGKPRAAVDENADDETGSPGRSEKHEPARR